jgi:hypothetical protein
MAANFKLQVLLLAKMQWDVRQRPDDAITNKVVYPWPRKVLRAGVLSNMVSPCVAGDLLQQRAPGLVPHSYTCHRMVRTLGGRRREPVERRFATLAYDQLGHHLSGISGSVRVYQEDKQTFQAVGEHCDLTASGWCVHRTACSCTKVSQQHSWSTCHAILF